HIGIHHLLLNNRKEAVDAGLSNLSERYAWKAWKLASLSRKMMNLGNGDLKNKVVNGMFKGWTKHRGNLHFSKKTFNQMWKEQRGRH
ncbi:MAG TPA: [Fe-S]-binding protein, partial [Ferruginibacter sp.]|nr:[Fe-S]-binding protein [Ferruginibacter sp.]